MFPKRFWPARFFPGRFWPKIGAAPPDLPTGGTIGRTVIVSADSREVSATFDDRTVQVTDG